MRVDDDGTVACAYCGSTLNLATGVVPAVTIETDGDATERILHVDDAEMHRCVVIPAPRR